MSEDINLNDYFAKIKKELEDNNLHINDLKDINYGLQFSVTNLRKKELIRIYSSKKGTKLDLSQVKDNEFHQLLVSILDGNYKPINKENNQYSNQHLDIDLMTDIIGTDESGKGDYFGPLVIAGVYVNNEQFQELKQLGVTDSKKLSDNNIKKLTPLIKRNCIHSTVVIGNQKYNELYIKMNNLNKLLAWGHARVIENILEKNVNCIKVLSDQFGDEKLIQNALLKKGQNIMLFQQPKAERNIAVAAASIIARYEFITRLEKMGKEYNLLFSKGASDSTVQTAKKFISRFGHTELGKVAKLHFKTTEMLSD